MKRRTIGRGSLALRAATAAAAGLLVLAAGCHKAETPSAPIDAQGQMQKIQNDPHIPPAAKARAIGAIKQGQASGAQGHKK